MPKCTAIASERHGARPKNGHRTGLARPLFPRRHRAGRSLAAGGRRIRDRSRRPGPARRAPCPRHPQPENQQAFTCCFIADYLDGQDHTIERPAEYGFWRDFVPALKPSWPGRLLDLTFSDPIRSQAGHSRVRPPRRGRRPVGLPANRRSPQLPARQLSRQCGHYPGQLAAKRLLARSLDRRQGHGRVAQRHVARAKQLSLRFCTGFRPNARVPTAKPAGRDCGCDLTWLEPTTDLPRPPTFANRGRILAELTVTRAARRHRGPPQGSESPRTLQAEPFPDSVGLGSYRIDLHPSTGGDNYIDISSLALSGSLGCLDPTASREPAAGLQEPGDDPHHKRLLSACIPVEWNIGEAAGALAAYCLEQQTLRGRSGIRPSG